jgi:hypothetical protein
MKATGAPIPPNEKPTAMTEDDYFRAAWSAAMTDVAGEMAISNQPDARRRPPNQRAQRYRQRPDPPRTTWSMIILRGTPTGCESCDQIVYGLKTSAAR